MLFSRKIPSHVTARLTVSWYWVTYLLLFATIRDSSRLFTTVRHYSHYSRLFAIFALFALRYSRLLAIRYSGFPDTPLHEHVMASYCTVTTTTDKWQDMWWMWPRLCAGSFYDFFSFSRRRLRYFALSALDLGNLNASTATFIEIWGNCPCLFYILTNTTVNRHGFQDVHRGNNYILIAFVD